MFLNFCPRSQEILKILIYIILNINLICSDMHLIFSYVLKHNLSHLIQFFGIVCMNQNEDTNIFNFHQIHELGFFPCFEFAKFPWSGEKS